MSFNQENRWHAVKQSMQRVKMGALSAIIATTLSFGMVGCAQAMQSSADASNASSATAASAQSATSTTDSQTSDAASGIQVTTADESAYDLTYTDRDKDASYDASSATKISLSGATANVQGSGAQAESGIVTITQEGVYVLSGTFEGQIVVDAADTAKVQIILDNATISSGSGPAIWVKQADKCFITLAANSQNNISESAQYADASTVDENAAIYSTCDLTLQGTGKLSVSSQYNDAVKTKDDLVVTGGTYNITAAVDGLVGKDSVKIADGTLTIEAQTGDGVKSSKDDDAAKGFVSIDGGSIAVTAGDKGIKAETYLRISGGAVEVTAQDDALHCDGSGRVLGGNVKLNAGDDALHVEYELVVDSGAIDVEKSTEGLEGQVITINDGVVNVVSSDDAINASTPDALKSASSANASASQQQMPQSGSAPSASNPSASSQSAPNSAQSMQAAAGQSASAASPGASQQSGRGQRSMQSAGGKGQGMMESDDSCVLTINGGTVTVDSEGDGLDSNGSIVINGGTVYVNGPTRSGNGALDSGNGTITANGGTLIAVGTADMVEGFSGGTQPFAQTVFNGSAGKELQVVDANGNVVASFTPSKSYQCVIVSAPGMKEGSTYTVNAGGETASITASTTPVAQGNMGGMGGMRR